MKGHLTQFGVSRLSQRQRHLSGHQKDVWESAQWKIEEGQSVLDKEDNEAKTCRWESSSALLGHWKLQAKTRSHEVLLLLLLLSHVRLFATLWTAARRPPCPLPSPGVCSNSCPLSQWCHSTVSSSVFPFSSGRQSFQAQGLFKRVSSSNQVAKVLEFQLQHQSFQWTPRTISFRMDWLDLLAVQGTLKSLPTPQFKSISSSVFSFLYGPTLTSIHDYWKNHSFDYMDLCWQSDVSCTCSQE